jgi:predicted CopG family antitoxin
MAIRPPELEIAARIGITPEAYEILRAVKKRDKQSMVKLVSDLIIEKYANGATTQTAQEAVKKASDSS